MKIKEFRELSGDELATRRRDLKEELFNLHVQKERGQLDNPARIRLVRRALAKIETVVSERRKAAAVAATS